jgi:hypothetical protein
LSPPAWFVRMWHIAVHSRFSDSRQLSGPKRKYGIVMPTLAIWIADQQMIVDHRARAELGWK